MIRVVQRRLIIPCGDTGTFTLPLLPGTEQGDVAVFSIYDTLTKEVLLQKEKEITEQDLTFEFVRADTIDIVPSDDRYVWDVRIYHEPIYNENGIPYDGTSINSYYSAFELPLCQIRIAP